MITEENGRYTIQNRWLSATCLPERGGKLISIFDKMRNFELLFQNPCGIYEKADETTPFEKSDASGFDDAYPSIDKETIRHEDSIYLYPDHGEVWYSPMQVSIRGESIYLALSSRLFDYSYEKTISLEENSLRLDYKMTNTGKKPFPAFWTMHCLAAMEDDMEIFLPEGVQNIVNTLGSMKTPLGEKGKVLEYPIDGKLNFSKVVNPYDSGSCSKFYCLGEIKEGKCGYIYPKHSLKVTIGYDSAKLPYLGFWKTVGGFRGDYNCALEPSSGFYDSISEAKKNGCCPISQPGQTIEFPITLTFDALGERNGK